MNDFLRLLGVDIYWSKYMPDLPTGNDAVVFLLILAICIAGTVIINGFLSHKSFLNTFVNFCDLWCGAIIANIVGANWSTPGLDELVKIAVLANFGMAIAGFMLLFLFREKQSA